MGDEIIDFNEEMSRIFSGKKRELKPDEELALYIKHKFNIGMDTMETMPAFDAHIKSLFLKKEK
ncbi:MAG: hypothetical protein MUO82_10145 [Candidatus Thermoplasmatota archaeon]|nr:hypothetical protein [Candidatus Thermoplasmatota archaeon]